MAVALDTIYGGCYDSRPPFMNPYGVLEARGRLPDPYPLSAIISGLFASGAPGVWYDFADFSGLFQDAAGTTPVTAVEQPVGLLKDKSGRNNHAFQTTSANRPVLSARYNQFVGTETLATQSLTTLAATYLLRFEGTGSITLSGTATGTYTAGVYSVTCTAGTLTATVSGGVTKADLRVANDGINLPPYQAVRTATDYDTVGFPLYLLFNGSTQFLQTNSIDFSSTDKMLVVAGVRKLSDAAIGFVVELGNTPPSGSFSLRAPYGAATTYSFSSIGSAGVTAASPSGYASPITNVLSGFGDISGDQALLRINGAQVAQSTGDQGTGNYGNYQLYIGARAGTSLFFNGRLYSLIIAGIKPTDAQILGVETYINRLTKAF